MRLLRYAPSDSSTYFKYASWVLGRKPCIHIRLYLLATNPCEKCGLTRNSKRVQYKDNLPVCNTEFENTGFGCSKKTAYKIKARTFRLFETY